MGRGGCGDDVAGGILAILREGLAGEDERFAGRGGVDHFAVARLAFGGGVYAVKRGSRGETAWDAWGTIPATAIVATIAVAPATVAATIPSAAVAALRGGLLVEGGLGGGGEGGDVLGGSGLRDGLAGYGRDREIAGRKWLRNGRNGGGCRSLQIERVLAEGW